MEHLFRLGISLSLLLFSVMLLDTIKELMSYPKSRSVKVINNLARLRSIHKEVNYINYK